MIMKKLLCGLTLMGALAVGAFSAVQVSKPIETHASSTKTLYLLANWASWESPMIHYWGGAQSTVYDSRPHMNFYSYAIDSGAEKKVYSFDLPTDTTAFLITQDNNTTQTADFVFPSTWGAYESDTFHFFYDYDAAKDKVEAYSSFDLVSEGYYLRGSWENGWNCVGQKKMRFVREGVYSITDTFDFTEDSNTNVKAGYLAKNDANFDWYQPTGHSGNAPKCGHEYWGNAWIGENHARANVTISGGVYTINTDDSDGVVTAIDFATRFTDAMHMTCPISSSNEGYDSVASSWSTFSSEFSGLNADVKTKLSSGAQEELVAFRNMYKIVLGVAGVSAFSDFAPAASQTISKFTTESTTLSIGIFLGVVLFVSLAGVSVIMIRRKTNN